MIYTSTLRRTLQTAEPLVKLGYKKKRRQKRRDERRETRDERRDKRQETRE